MGGWDRGGKQIRADFDNDELEFGVDEDEVEDRKFPGKELRTSRLASLSPVSNTPGKCSAIAAITDNPIMRKASDAAIREDAHVHLSRAAASAGTMMPQALLEELESALGTDLSSVRVHTDEAATAAAQAVGARAFARGTDVYFGAGEYDTSSVRGRELIAHEVAHTVQATAGSEASVVSQEGDAHEVEADRFAEAFASGGASEAARARPEAPAPRGVLHRTPSEQDPPARLLRLPVNVVFLDPVGDRVESDLQTASEFFRRQGIDLQVGRVRRIEAAASQQLLDQQEQASRDGGGVAGETALDHSDPGGRNFATGETRPPSATREALELLSLRPVPGQLTVFWLPTPIRSPSGRETTAFAFDHTDLANVPADSESAVIAHRAPADALPHELMHLLLHAGHAEDPNNILADGQSRTGSEVTPEQRAQVQRAVERWNREEQPEPEAASAGPRERDDETTDPDRAVEGETEEGNEEEADESDLAAKLVAVVPALSPARAAQLAPHLEAAMQRFGIDSAAQQAMFVAQTAHETGGYRTFRERGSAARFDRQYAGRLGNTREHDGSRYRGRGAIQVTGRSGYRRHGQRIGIDLEADPERAEQDDVAFLVSASYWGVRRAPTRSWFESHRAGLDWSWIPSSRGHIGLNAIAQLGTGEAYDHVSVAINPRMPYERIAQRRAWFTRAAPAFGVSGEQQPEGDNDGEASDSNTPTDPAASSADSQVQQRASEEAEESANVRELATAGISGGGGALPHAETIQEAFGRHDVGGISSHVGGAAAGAAAGMGALAYATGEDVAFARAPDLHTAAHEAAHVVQQRAGVSLSGGVGERGDIYEQHADAVADAVVGGGSAEALLDQFSGATREQGRGDADAVVSKVSAPEHTDEGECGCEGCAAPAPVQMAPAPSTKHDHGCDCEGCFVQRKADPASALTPSPKVSDRGIQKRSAPIVQRLEGDTLESLRAMELRDLFALFVFEGESTARSAGGESVTFTGGWLRGRRGTAILRGELRQRILAAVHTGQHDSLVAQVESLSGADIRITELRRTIESATARNAEVGDDGDPTTTGLALIDEGTQGRTMRRRGTLRTPLERNEGESDARYERRVRAKENEIHSAMDVNAAEGTGVFAPVAGRVIWAAPGGPGRRASAGYGNFVKIVHDSPPETQIAGARRVTTHYCHLDEVLVSAGSTVSAGQAIGLVGATRENARGNAGRVAGGMGNHLHFGVQIAAEGEEPGTQVSSAGEMANAINPAIWLGELGVRLSEVGYERLRQRDGRRPVVRGRPANPAAAEAETVQQKRKRSAPRQRSGSVRRAVQFERPDNLVAMANFCGASLSLARGVVPTLKARLQSVHNHLQTEFEALPDEERARAGSLRGYAGIDTIRGYRAGSRMHGVGEAVDVNYAPQPYIVTRTPTNGRTTYGGEAGSPVARQPVTAVYDRAVAFVRRDEAASETADVSNRRRGESATAAYRRFRRTSDALRDYLGLAFRRDYESVERVPLRDAQSASEADLLGAIPLRERRDEASAIALIESVTTEEQWLAAHAGEHIGARDYYIQMLRDYETVRRPMQHGRTAANPQRTRNPARGFLHLPEHFVVAMMEVGRLRWGACEFGARASGDVHHFDLDRPTHVAADSPGAGSVQRRADPGAEGTSSHAVAREGASGAGSTIPFLAELQASFGAHNLSAVRAHTDRSAQDASRTLGARAYATGNDIVFAQQPDLHTAAHEAAHVVQQRAGVALAGGFGESGDQYERHADEVADAVVRGESAEPLLNQFLGQSRQAGVVQLDGEERSVRAGADCRMAEAVVDIASDRRELRAIRRRIRAAGRSRPNADGLVRFEPLPGRLYLIDPRDIPALDARATNRLENWDNYNPPAAAECGPAEAPVRPLPIPPNYGLPERRGEDDEGESRDGEMPTTELRVFVIGSPGEGEVNAQHPNQFVDAARYAGIDENTIWIVERTGYEIGGVGTGHIAAMIPRERLRWLTPENSFTSIMRGFPRNSIRTLTVFSHGVPGLVALRYGWDGHEPYGISRSEVSGFRSTLFMEGAEINFESCNTGTTDDGYNLAEDVSDRSNRDVRAWTGRTSYSEVNDGDEDGDTAVRASRWDRGPHLGFDLEEMRSRAIGRTPVRQTFRDGEMVQRRGTGREISPPDAHEAAALGVSGPAAQLPHAGRIQKSFGHHLIDRVEAHTNGQARAANESLGSTAYAFGESIAFDGLPDLFTTAHEAAHVVQQRAGVSVDGGVGQAGDQYERHADDVAEAVVAGRNAEALLDATPTSASRRAAVQKQEAPEQPPSATAISSEAFEWHTLSPEDLADPSRQVELDGYRQKASSRLADVD